jgi:hypothetical protein
MAKKDSNGNPIGKSRGIRRLAGEVVDWESIDGQKLIRAIAAAAAFGGAIRCGYSRDGGVYSIGIYGDGDPYTEYCRTAEELDIILVKVEELFQTLMDERAAEKTAKNKL